MVQAGDRFGLALEALTARGIVCEMHWKDFDGDTTLKGSIPRLVNLTHPAGAEWRDNLVGTKFFARG
jgi:hypothetical protein